MRDERAHFEPLWLVNKLALVARKMGINIWNVIIDPISQPSEGLLSWDVDVIMLVSLREV